MDDGLKKILIGMAAGALGLSVTGCSSEPASEAAPALDETQTTGQEPAGSAEPAGAATPTPQATTPEPERRLGATPSDDDAVGTGMNEDEASCGAGSCASPE